MPLLLQVYSMAHRKEASVQPHTLTLFFPILREERVDLVDRMVVDTIKDIGEPFFGIDVVVFASGEEGIDRCDALSRVMGTRKEVVFATDCSGSDDVFHEVIVDFQGTIAQVGVHVFPAIKPVLERLTDFTFGQDLIVLFLHPGVEQVKNRFGFLLA